jgi:hypothetical protein
MGASLTMIDRHYGHLARDGREHAAGCSTHSPEMEPQLPRGRSVDAATGNRKVGQERGQSATD